jgi:glycerol-3-phosphate acyltransferase PlsY
MEDVFTVYNIVAIIIAYLIGSVPSAIWVSKWFFGVDVRDYGSKNAGATNTFRVIGKKAGFPVLFFDILKGWASVKFLSMFSSYTVGTNQFVNLQLAIGMAAVFGHVFPIYERFKGGKGVATLLGIILAINFPAAGLSFVVFLLTFVISQYVSLGAIMAAFFFPLLTIFVFKAQTPSLIYFSIVISIMVILTHRKNIERLLKKEENKMPLNIKSKR